MSWADVVKGNYIKCLDCGFVTDKDNSDEHCCCRFMQTNCQGRNHDIEYYYDTMSCRDCGWGGCRSLDYAQHCCCQGHQPICTEDHFERSAVLHNN